ncbi:hypothetical protein SSS_07846 [Sarcoptes scabiei]|uniref:Gem-associated protein 2 n=1 Tax=Sarcoptes scabiei TaxID=52283 RepID=A0A834RAK2_SARSC|nr:hypothetical protein SSS_07846 [Sarcoptes scabiei]
MISLSDNEDDDCDYLKEYSDEEDDDEFISFNIVQRLPVADFDHYDPKIPPVDGADFLRRVQLESEQLPKIKVAGPESISKFIVDNRIQKTLFNDNNDEFIRSVPIFSIDETIILPKLIRQFEIFKKFIEKSKKSIKNELKNDFKIDPNDKDQIEEYCFKKNIEDNRNHYSTLINQLEQEEICRLTQYQYEWLCNDTNQREDLLERCRWIFMLLGAMDPIQSDHIIDLLRKISRQCSRIRNRVEIELSNLFLIETNRSDSKDVFDDRKLREFHHNVLSSLNLIILLIAHYFLQKDLCNCWSDQ